MDLETFKSIIAKVFIQRMLHQPKNYASLMDKQTIPTRTVFGIAWHS